MKKILIFPITALLLAKVAVSQVYLGKTCEISFFSDGITEDIEAKNTSTKPILNTKTDSLLFKVSIQGFVFESKLMQEHFNETYMESEKFPHATFRGKINQDIVWTKDTTYKVTVTGKLNIHGVTKERTMDGTVTIKGGEIVLETKFNVAVKDHGITVPSLMTAKIAEIVEVKMKSTLTELKK